MAYGNLIYGVIIMPATETALSALERNWGMVDKALDGVDDNALGIQPNDQSNSMGWLLWHMSRVVDRFIHARFQQDAPQMWIKDGWHEKFGLDADPNTTGMGWSAEQVAAWKLPAKHVLVEYYEAVKTTARDYISALSESDLERQIPFPTLPDTAPIRTVLGVLVYDNIVHGGQIAYLKGYHKGMGWFF